ncbi:MAG: hypothetical protein J6A58_12800 [Oscillospiraceae bacterium]|nr:hypothetical protein [Oscillospiraceae bacterium]
MKIIKAIPLSEVNGIKFGAKREEVRKVFGEAKEFKKTSFSKTTTDDFGFCHVYYNVNDEFEAIEIFNEVDVKINDVIVFPNNDISVLKSMFADFEDDEDGTICKSQSIGVYAPDGEMECILFGCIGYYE